MKTREYLRDHNMNGLRRWMRENTPNLTGSTRDRHAQRLLATRNASRGNLLRLLQMTQDNVRALHFLETIVQNIFASI